MRTDMTLPRRMSRPFSFFAFNKLLNKLDPSLARSMSLSLFLDFDGTLTPIAGHPADTALSQSMRDVLILLSRVYRVVIISGRGIDDLKEKISIEGTTYVGNHGMEMSDGEFSFIYDIGEVESAAIEEVAGRLGGLTSEFDGVVIEEKGLTLSIHYRLLSSSRKTVFLKRVERILRPFNKEGTIKETYGKGLVEIRPTAEWNKGSAVEWLMGRNGFNSSIPLSIGDDETDEDAFRAIKGTGISIFVGKRKSEADLFLSGQSEVEPMLARLVAMGADRRSR